MRIDRGAVVRIQAQARKREFRQIDFPHGHHARRHTMRHRCRIFSGGRTVSTQCRATGRDRSRHVEKVFPGDRYAVQWSATVALRQPRGGGFGFIAGARRRDGREDGGVRISRNSLKEEFGYLDGVEGTGLKPAPDVCRCCFGLNPCLPQHAAETY